MLVITTIFRRNVIKEFHCHDEFWLYSPKFHLLLINKINNLIGFCLIVYRYQNSFVVIELLKWPVHPITATRTLFITKTYYEHAIIPWPKYHPWGSYSRFENVFQKSENVGPSRCCIFSHCVSCSSVYIILVRQLWWPLL